MTMVDNMRLIKLSLVYIFTLNAMVACSPTEVTAESTSGEPTITSSLSPTAELIRTETPVLETAELSSPTSLPADTYPLNVWPWPETGSIKHQVNDGVIFEMSPSQLASGDYLIIIDSDEHAVKYVSLSTEEEGVLLRLDEGLSLPRVIFVQDSQYILAESSNPWRFYDLSNQIAWEIGPLCDHVSSRVSSDGQWLHASCEEIYEDDMGAEIHISEIISIEDGKSYRVAVPYSGSIYEIQYTWFNQDRLIVSKVRDDSAQAICSISISNQLMYCPPIVKVGKNIRYLIQNLGQYVAFQNLDSFPWQGILISETCFIPGEDCGQIIDLGEVEGFLVPSPEDTLVGWTTGVGLTGYTKFGYYDTANWESVEIAELEGNYNIDAWCPDASCLIIYMDESYSRYRLDLDGTFTPLSYEKVIGSFSIP
jgi:hypothetical protein